MQQETNAGDLYMRKILNCAVCSAAVNVIVCPSFAAVLDQLSQNFDQASVLVCTVHLECFSHEGQNHQWKPVISFLA